MNLQSQLDDLCAITQAKYQQQQQSFQKIIAQEAHLRGELARLDELRLQSRADADNAGNMQAVGADILWQGWVARSKTQLNLHLAKVMAQKLHHLTQVKQAYGKMLVAQNLSEQSRSKLKTEKAQDALSQAIQLSLQE